MPRKKASNDPNDPTIRIKKYGNRRLYSMEESKYITLGEVERLVREGHPVKVIDASNDKDITSEILTQILLENGKVKNFPASVLMEMVRMQDDALKTFYERYMQLGLDFFVATQKEFGKFYEGMIPFPKTPNLSDLTSLFSFSKNKDESGEMEDSSDLREEIAVLKKKLEGYENSNHPHL